MNDGKLFEDEPKSRAGRRVVSEGQGVLMAGSRLPGTASDLWFLVGAGEGNRTLMTSLEGFGQDSR